MDIKDKTDPRELRISEIMQRNFVYVSPDQSIHEAANLMSMKNIGMLPVIKEDNILLGVITDRDIIVRVIANKQDPSKAKVSEHMTQNPCRVVPNMSCSDAMYMMSKCKVRRVAVVKNHKLVGIISSSDIAQVFNFCPHERECILTNIANELQKSSHLNNKCCAIAT